MDIQLNQILLQALNFGILFVILVKFLFGPIQKMLDKRAAAITEGLKAAEANLKEAEKMEKKREAEMARAEAKAAEIIAQAREESKKLGASLIDEAKVESAKLMQKQEAAFMTKLSGEEQELKKRIGALVVETTKSVLEGSLSAAELKSVTKKALAKLEK